MFSRRTHLLALATAYLVLPAIMVHYRYAAYGLPITEISGFLELYGIVLAIITPGVIGIQALNIEQALLDDPSAASKREVFRHVLWKELHDKFFPTEQMGKDWFADAKLRRETDERREQ